MHFLFILILTLCFNGCTVQKTFLTTNKDIHPIQSLQISEEVLATELAFDAKTGEIKYTLPEDARVRIRIGIPNGGPMLLNVLDWEERKKGAQVEHWDKKDKISGFDLSDRNDLMVVLTARREKTFNIDQPGTRKAPKFDVMFPEAQVNNDAVTLKDITPIRVTIAEDDHKWLSESRYEIALYVDQIFLHEEEQGVSPFTYLWNTKGINEGEHILTVDLISLDGEVGTSNIKFLIKNSP